MKLSEFDDLALNYACPACEAKPREWCRTFRPTRRPKGARASWLHSPRLNPIFHAWSSGYEDGQQDGITVALDDPERARARLAPPKENL